MIAYEEKAERLHAILGELDPEKELTPEQAEELEHARASFENEVMEYNTDSRLIDNDEVLRLMIFEGYADTLMPSAEADRVIDGIRRPAELLFLSAWLGANGHKSSAAYAEKKADRLKVPMPDVTDFKEGTKPDSAKIAAAQKELIEAVRRFSLSKGTTNPGPMTTWAKR